MLNLPDDIHSLTEFKRHTTEMVQQLRRTGRPVVLTVNGKAEIVVQDARSYQQLLDRVEAAEGIRRGLDDVKKGKNRPAREALAAIRKRRAIPKE